MQVDNAEPTYECCFFRAYDALAPFGRRALSQFGALASSSVLAQWRGSARPPDSLLARSKVQSGGGCSWWISDQIRSCQRFQR
jgi:hypothetical protein